MYVYVILDARAKGKENNPINPSIQRQHFKYKIIINNIIIAKQYNSITHSTCKCVHLRRRDISLLRADKGRQ